jgi:hypothetical protein
MPCGKLMISGSFAIIGAEITRIIDKPSIPGKLFRIIAGGKFI